MAKTQKRRWQFRLRSLFFVIPMIAAAICIFQLFSLARAEKASVQWVHQQNGSVVYDYESKSTGSNRGRPPYFANWLGLEFVANVRTVVLDNTWITDLSPILGLQNLNTLAIYIDVFPETDLSVLKNLRELKSISFKSTNLTPQQMIQIEQLKTALPKCTIDIGADVTIRQW